ncbi:hypothetical protein GOBAR_DD16599 [Gossypium barbadense]|nr:hypothetical protein GOBAR_DD16599 [Gossypium barbadense]
MFPTKPLQRSSDGIVHQVMSMMVQNRPFDAQLASSTISNPWTTDSVSDILRSVPKFFFQSLRSIGRQKGFRHRAPLKQRNLKQEKFKISHNVLLLGPAAYRDPERVALGLYKAMEFYLWVEKFFGFSHNEKTCKEMAFVLAKGNNLKGLWDFLKEMSRIDNGSLVTTSSITCLIKVLGEEGLVNEALACFFRMKQYHCKPDVFAYNMIIRALCRVGNFNKARYYCAVNEIDKGIEMMRRMQRMNHGVATNSSYTPIIHALCEAERVLEAKGFLFELIRGGSIPREYTYKLVCDALNSVGAANLIDDEMHKRIRDGIGSRCRQVMKVKHITSHIRTTRMVEEV